MNKFPEIKRKVQLSREAQVNIEVNFEARKKLFDELLRILHRKLALYQKALEEDKFKTELEKVELEEKIWHLKGDITAKLDYLAELILRQNKK